MQIIEVVNFIHLVKKQNSPELLFFSLNLPLDLKKTLQDLPHNNSK